MMIKRMTLLRDTPGMKLWLDGKAKHVQSGSAEFPTDHRLSKFDVWWHHPKVQSLFGLWKDMK